jgi:hypothetical protein
VLPQENIMTLRELQESCAQKNLIPKNMIDALDVLLNHVETLLPKKALALSEVAEMLGMTPDQMSKRFIGSIVIRANGFELYKRAKHVFSEARRVFLFQKVCQDPSANLYKVCRFLWIYIHRIWVN